MAYVAKRAVILAAGRGLRLNELTQFRPKPLLCFAGRPIIENVVERILAAGIDEIAVVTGYMAPSFSYLSEKYKGIKLVYNESWDKGNNVLSVCKVLPLLSDALVVNGDALIADGALKKEYLGTTMYADRSRGFSSEWELVLRPDRSVWGINRLGGVDILQHREATFVCSADHAEFSRSVLQMVQKNEGMNEYFEFALFPNCKVFPLEVAHNSIFDLDDTASWMAHPLTQKKI